MRLRRGAAATIAGVARLVNAFGLVLLLVLATFAAMSLFAFNGWGAVGITAVSAITALVALHSARTRRRIVGMTRLAALAALLFAVIAAIGGGRWLYGLAAVITIITLSFGASAVLRAVVTEEEVGFRTILGAISVYMVIGIGFAFLYVAVERIQHTPFFGPDVHLGTGDFPFFSMTTLTTTGYGNIVPAGQPGKMFAVFEMLTGQIFVVTLVARLVTLWEPGRWLREGAGIARRRKRGEDAG